MVIMYYYWLIVAFILGTIVGSFLNVVIARMPMEKSLIWPGSRCGSCFQAIRWYDNIPLVSYLWLAAAADRAAKSSRWRTSASNW